MSPTVLARRPKLDLCGFFGFFDSLDRFGFLCFENRGGCRRTLRFFGEALRGAPRLRV